MSTSPTSALSGSAPVAATAVRSAIPRAPVAVVPRPGWSPAHEASRAAAPRDAVPVALRDIEAARARIDLLLEQARRGRSFSAQELLCLQADAHRFSQTVEIAARAVEHGVQGLRQALQSQV